MEIQSEAVAKKKQAKRIRKKFTSREWEKNKRNEKRNVQKLERVKANEFTSIFTSVKIIACSWEHCEELKYSKTVHLLRMFRDVYDNDKRNRVFFCFFSSSSFLWFFSTRFHSFIVLHLFLLFCVLRCFYCFTLHEHNTERNFGKNRKTCRQSVVGTLQMREPAKTLLWD